MGAGRAVRTAHRPGPAAADRPARRQCAGSSRRLIRHPLMRRAYPEDLSIGPHRPQEALDLLAERARL